MKLKIAVLTILAFPAWGAEKPLSSASLHARVVKHEGSEAAVLRSLEAQLPQNGFDSGKAFLTELRVRPDGRSAFVLVVAFNREVKQDMTASEREGRPVFVYGPKKGRDLFPLRTDKVTVEIRGVIEGAFSKAHLDENGIVAEELPEPSLSEISVKTSSAVPNGGHGFSSSGG